MLTFPTPCVIRSPELCKNVSVLYNLHNDADISSFGYPGVPRETSASIHRLDFGLGMIPPRCFLVFFDMHMFTVAVKNPMELHVFKQH